MIHYYTWKQLDIDNYLLDCFDELESVKWNLSKKKNWKLSRLLLTRFVTSQHFQVQNIVDDYKYCNIEIVNICEKITNLTLFKTNQVQTFELKDLKKKIETIK